jgi:hypothetical protein
VDRSHRRGVPHKTNLADSADSARNINDPLTVRLVCTKIPYQSIYGSNGLFLRELYAGGHMCAKKIRILPDEPSCHLKSDN